MLSIPFIYYSNIIWAHTCIWAMLYVSCVMPMSNWGPNPLTLHIYVTLDNDSVIAFKCYVKFCMILPNLGSEEQFCKYKNAFYKFLLFDLLVVTLNFAPSTRCDSKFSSRSHIEYTGDLRWDNKAIKNETTYQQTTEIISPKITPCEFGNPQLLLSYAVKGAVLNSTHIPGSLGTTRQCMITGDANNLFLLMS